jgi:hypothetical protein
MQRLQGKIPGNEKECRYQKDTKLTQYEIAESRIVVIDRPPGCIVAIAASDVQNDNQQDHQVAYIVKKQDTLSILA